jgi:hypothetical protein
LHQPRHKRKVYRRRNAGADGLLPAPVVAQSAHYVVAGGDD